MELNLRQETESRIQALSAATGRLADDLVEDALAGYLHDLEQTRSMLDSLRRSDEWTRETHQWRRSVLQPAPQEQRAPVPPSASEFVLHPEALYFHPRSDARH